MKFPKGILWVWQTFGFLSAVERARELIEHLATEVRSNPRLGIMQLFGSDSGFVVSHAVLASKTGICDVALIPEVNFSMKQLSAYLKKKMCERYTQEQKGRIPYGFVVMAETAIPTDAIDYIDDPKIALSDVEKDAVRTFDLMRHGHKRIEGQTDDSLRTAGLKIVSKGLQKLLPKPGNIFSAQRVAATRRTACSPLPTGLSSMPPCVAAVSRRSDARPAAPLAAISFTSVRLAIVAVFIATCRACAVERAVNRRGP